MQSHRYKIGGNYLVLLFLLIILILSSFGFFYFGEVRINVLKVLLNNEINEKELFILYKIRLPRLILAISVGGILSICGAVLQGIFRNPMVEPFTLGISGGAALGISIAISTGIVSYTGSIGLPIFGFIGSVFTIFLVYYLTVYDGIFSINRMLLIGIMISFISSSLITLIMSLSTKDDLFRIIYWTMGSLDESNALLIKSVFFSSIIGFILIYIFSNSLNAIQLGQEKAEFLGINTQTTIRLLFIVTSLLTGICVSISGIIGFVGLIIPHTIKIIVGTDFRISLPASFLGGSILLVISDIIARTIISPNILPIGVITGIVGGPIFILLLLNRYKKSNQNQI